MYKLTDIIEMFEISERSVRRHLKLGILKGTKVKGQWEFTESELEDYLSHPMMDAVIRLKSSREVAEYIKGLMNPELILVSKNLKKITNKEIKELSKKISSITGPMKFTLKKESGHINVLFFGTEQGVQEFLKITKLEG